MRRPERAALVRAPELDAPGVVWLGAPGPPTLRALRGRFVLLDFWTLGCVNCIHVVPTLRRIEAAFPDEVVVIGVHSPKFDAEREPARVRRAIERLGVRHPVAHDPDRRLWDAYAVRAWPTLVLVDPAGRIAEEVVGEPEPAAFAARVAERVRAWRERGELRPVAAPAAAPAAATGRLAFPGGIARLPAGGFAVADTGHHQVALFDEDGVERARYGGGRAGLGDGDAEGAAFASPQGLAAGANALYVADAGNHALRAIDLAAGRVATLAGTGARGRILRGEGAAEATELASPWDVALDGDRLYFANAGTHQLGALDLRRGRVAPLAGAGGENLVDGPAHAALLAQPSGLALDAATRRLWFVDAEASALRVLELAGEPRVATLVGSGLFAWGSATGRLDEARLQHPLGLALHDGRLFVADTYNDAVRVVDPRAGTVEDAVAGFTCVDPVCRPLAEPAAIAFDAAGERMLVADAANGRIVAYELATRTERTWAA